MGPQNERRSGPVIVISGVPGAGKSTVAGLVARRFARAAHIEADTLQRMIVSGASWPDPRLTPESAHQLRLRVTNGCRLADSFVEAGFCAVLDDIFVGDRIEALRADLVTRPFHFVMLNPSLDVLRTRNASRSKRDAFHEAEYLYPVLQQTPRIGLWLDTSALDAAQTADRIIASLALAEVTV